MDQALVSGVEASENKPSGFGTGKFMRYLLKFYDFGSLICFSVMMSCVLIEVVSRNIIMAPTTWAEELSRLMCIYAVFLGSASAWYRGSHIVINVLLYRLTGQVKLGMVFIAQILTGLFAVGVWYGTLDMMIVQRNSTSTALEISVSWFYLGLFIGVTGMVIFHAGQMLQTIKEMKAGPQAA